MDIESLIDSLEKAENDNKKFALLLILSELIKSNKLDESIKTDKSINERLFNGIGSHFLARLLASKQQVENSPVLYKSLGLSILTQFLDYPNLITDPVILTKIDSIFEVIKTDYGQDTVGNNVKLDAFKYVYALSNTCPDFLYQNGLIDILINNVILNEKLSDKDLKLIYDFNDEPEKTNFPLVSCKIISNLVKDVIESKIKDETFPVSKTNEKIEKSFRVFLETVAKLNSEFKFILINYLNYFLNDSKSIQKYILYDQDLNNLTSKVVFEILNDLFKSQVKPYVIEMAFLLLNNFVKMYDFETIYMKNRNFFYLIIHLLCIQIGICLQDSYQPNNKNQLKVDIINKMSIYYSLLEQIIIILSTASPFDTGDDSEENEDEDEFEEEPFRKGIKEETDNYEPEFKKVIKIVVEVLETIIVYIKDTLLDDFSQIDTNSTFLLVSSIRILVCWMAHENLLEDEIMQQMPKIIKFSEYLKTSSYNINVYNFLTPGLNRILNDKSNKLEFRLKKSKTKEDLVKVEFEKSELNEQIENIQSMLDKCYKNINSLD